MLCLSRKMRTSTSNGESLTFTTEAGERIVVHFGERHGNILEVRIDAPKAVRIERTDNQKGAADARN